MDNVSWEDCQAFLRTLNHKLAASGAKFALPTEAQWEYACRAGGTGKFCFGDDVDRKSRGASTPGLKTTRSGTTHPVGQKKPNAWGLYDMHGNVWEWCADWYDAGYYGRSPENDPPGPSSGTYRVLRGGGWDFILAYCQTAYRNHFNTPTTRIHYYGLRVTCVPKP